jgi:hypothetical protein
MAECCRLCPFSAEALQVSARLMNWQSAAFRSVSTSANRFWVARPVVFLCRVRAGTTTRISEPVDAPSWFDLASATWLSLVANGLLNFKADEQAEEILHTALYWYRRSNITASGVDGSLILTGCALELLSWFVIVRRKRALTEDGYGLLNSASERLRLMLTLLSISRTFPSGLSELTRCAKREQWEDLADALVEARNYLVHPTKSRSGRTRERKDLPWYELWSAGQWVLELAILRLIDYSGQYHNRTKLRAFDRLKMYPGKASNLFERTG